MDHIAQTCKHKLDAVVVQVGSATRDELLALAATDSIAGLFAIKELERRYAGVPS